MKKIVIILCMIFISVYAFSQTVISGQIIDPKSSQPIPGYTVKIRGTKIATITDSKGNFLLKIPEYYHNVNFTIELLFIGYSTTSISIRKEQENSQIKILSNGIELHYSISHSEEISPALPTGIGVPANIPMFPWPPPKFSVAQVLKGEIFSSAKILSDVDNILSYALDALDYSDKSYYFIPHGFALVTRMEQIEENGQSCPEPKRWSNKIGNWPNVSFEDYIKSLFFSSKGYFRIIVFAVTDIPIMKGKTTVTENEAKEWLSSGMTKLPKYIGQLKYNDEYDCTALIYEFKQDENTEPNQCIPCNLTAMQHLKNSQILDKLTAKK